MSKSELGTKRTIILLKLSWTISIHKGQWLTVDKINIHLGKKEDTSGQTFVAISIIKNLNCIDIQVLTKETLLP